MTDAQKLDLILEKVSNVEKDVSGLKTEVGSLKTEVSSLKTEVSSLKTEVSGLKTEVGSLKTEVGSLKTDVGNLDKRVHTIEITLENETNRNIKLIAEGHLNLDRKLDEALRSLQLNTMYRLQVNHLDVEVQKIKEVVGMA